MGDFGNAVSVLLESFSNGLAVIKRLRRRRKETKTNIESSVRAEEVLLNKSLQTNRREIKSVYDDCAQIASFTTGDAEAEHSVATILFRLNAGFVSIIDKFVNGKSTGSDYRMLVNLSNASKLEAIQTFEQLQHRLSQPSLSLEKNQEVSQHHGKRMKHRKASNNAHTIDESSAISSKKASRDHVQTTYLGPATSKGWIRMKHGKHKTKYSPPRVSTSEHRTSSIQVETPLVNHAAVEPPSTLPLPVECSPDRKPSQRLSIMTFATTSTKIGEIPEDKWASTAGYQDYSHARPVFPLQPYVQPEKRRSRLRKIFRRDG